MGALDKEDIEKFKMKKLEKKYKDVFSSKDFIDKTSELDKQLKEMQDRLKVFDKDLEEHREKEQKKIRDFKDEDNKPGEV
ncbi:cytochrome P450 [Candidatus Woesearchaeota archaeon]|nr:cytochrome P450 [Candidatus Woesearchaeota archaeon]